MSPHNGANSGKPVSLAIVTPSYRFDRELCSDLAESVLRHTSGDVVHHIVVPRKDLRLFEPMAGVRTHIEDAAIYLPRSFVKVPQANVWVNVRRPFPPVRGWIAQQILKLAAVAAMQTDVVLLVDSDLTLVRSIEGSEFTTGGVVKLFRLPDGIDSSIPRHRLWHDAARRLLGLPPTPPGKLTDYICCPCAWSPTLVRRMLETVERVTGNPWETAIASEIHFSEMILYGVFVDEILNRDGDYPTTAEMHCVNHWDETPLDEAGLRRLLEGVRDSDIAVMISAKSGTPLEIRRRVLGEHNESAAS